MAKSSNWAVKYNNEMNKIELGKLSVRESDLLAAVCAYVKMNSTKKVSMPFDKIRELSGFSDRDNTRLHAELLALNRKLVTLYYEFEDERGMTGFNLFQWWRLGKDNTFEIAVSDVFEFMLNNLGGNFTKYELAEFREVKGKFAKPLYRLLKQFRRTGLYVVLIEDFRRLLNVPKSYRTTDIDRFVITPAVAELTEYFTDLTVTKQYKRGRGRGGQVVQRLEFTFQKQLDGSAEDEKSAEATAHDLRRLIAETEIKILSTKKAMDKQSDKGDWKQYEIHKKKNAYFQDKLVTLKRNLENFDPEQIELNIPLPSVDMMVADLVEEMRFKD